MAPVSVMLDTKNARRTIPIGILIICVIVGLVYALMSIVAAGVLPVQEVMGQNMSGVAAAIFNPTLYAVFILGAACCAIMSSLSSGMTMFKHPLLAVVHDGWLPPVFGKTTKGGFPYVIMGVFLVFSLLPIFTSFSVDSLISLIMIPSMIMNAYMNIRLIQMPKKYPKQWANATLRMPIPVFNVLCVLGTACALAVAFYLFKDLDTTSMIVCVILLVVLIGLSWLRLHTGAVKVEDLEAKRERIAAAAIAATEAEE